jgi:endonuclease/exonuclease/phosphatase family metal-dependent hydrolase
VADGLRFRIATYNIHRGRGLDGRERIDRIADVLREVRADVIALQEVFQSQAIALAEEIGATVAFGQTRSAPQGPYGNVCLSRLPLVAHERYNLTCIPFEPRGCLRADVDIGHAAPLHVLNVHLGLGYRERIRQVRMLSSIFGQAPLPGPRVLLGDFNEWFHGHASRLLRAEFGHARVRLRRLATHPSPMPVFPLDRIYHDPGVRIVRVGVHRSRLARVASDHLPTYADIAVLPPGERSNGAGRP